MELIGLLFIIALWDVSRHAVGHAREDYRSKTGPKSKGKKGAKGAGRDPDTAARAHRARGWWLRELGSGFAVTRTGWHTGWLGHRTEADRARREREEARTTHAEGRRGTQRDVAAFRKRQADARAEIEAQLAEWERQVPGVPPRGKRAVQEAGDEVERKRKEREQATGAKCPGCGAPEGYSHLDGCDPSAPPLPADAVGRSDPEVTDTPVRVHNAEDSAWLKPGEKRCEGCGGSGRNAAGNDACPACRGFGSAAPDPDSPRAPAGAVCGACGQNAHRGDPVLATDGGYLHRSHAIEQQERYQEALQRMRQGADDRDQSTGIAKEMLGTARCPQCATLLAGASLENSLWCPHCEDLVHKSEWATPDSLHDLQPAATAPAPGHVPDGACDCGLPACRSGWPEEASPANPSPTTQGAPVTDTNYTTVLANAKQAAADADQDAVTAAKRRQVAEQHAEEMQASNVLGTCLSAQMELMERQKKVEEATKAAGEQATIVSNSLQKEHGGIQAAVDDAPIPEPAQPAFYGGS